MICSHSSLPHPNGPSTLLRTSRRDVLNSLPPQPLGADDIPAGIKRFWHTFRWNANPWFRDVRGNMLLTSTYPRIADCSLASLQLSVWPIICRFSDTSGDASCEPTLCGKITPLGHLYPDFCARHPWRAGVKRGHAAPLPEAAAIKGEFALELPMPRRHWRTVDESISLLLPIRNTVSRRRWAKQVLSRTSSSARPLFRRGSAAGAFRYPQMRTSIRGAPDAVSLPVVCPRRNARPARATSLRRSGVSVL